VLWAHAAVNSPEADRYLRLTKQAETQVIGTPSAGPDHVIAKLALLLDWESEHMSASSRALLQSAIADLEGASPQPVVPEPKVKTIQVRVPKRRATPTEPAAFRASSMRIDARATPVIIDGILYPSIIGASRDTGMTIDQVRRHSRPL
jgi:hypothetical protein